MITYEVASATGHRKLTRAQQAWMEPELYRIARKLRDEHDCRIAVTGMALLVDQVWAEAVLKTGLMELYAVVPFPGQADRWTQPEKDRWQKLLRLVDKAIPVSEEDPRDGHEATRMLMRRNTKMLVISDVVVAVRDPRRVRGGTWAAVNEAVGRGLPMLWLNPVNEKTTMPTHERWREILTIARREGTG